MKATFWIDWNFRPMLMTLMPGDRIELSKSRTTEEGWEQETTVFCNNGDTIIKTVDWRGLDCDGRLDRSWQGEIEIRKLPKLAGARVVRPEWSNVARGQRDYSAEAAGY